MRKCYNNILFVTPKDLTKNNLNIRRQKKKNDTYCPPKCSVTDLRLLLLSSSAAGGRRRMLLPRCHPSSRCALEAESGSSSLVSTKVGKIRKQTKKMCSLSFLCDVSLSVHINTFYKNTIKFITKYVIFTKKEGLESYFALLISRTIGKKTFSETQMGYFENPL